MSRNILRERIHIQNMVRSRSSPMSWLLMLPAAPVSLLPAGAMLSGAVVPGRVSSCRGVSSREGKKSCIMERNDGSSSSSSALARAGSVSDMADHRTDAGCRCIEPQCLPVCLRLLRACAFASALLCPLKPSELDEPSLTFLPIPLHVGLHLHTPFW